MNSQNHLSVQVVRAGKSSDTDDVCNIELTAFEHDVKNCENNIIYKSFKLVPLDDYHEMLNSFQEDK